MLRTVQNLLFTLTLNFWWVSGRSAIFLPSAGIGLVQVEETQLDPVSQPDSMSTEAEHQPTMSKIALAMLIASTSSTQEFYSGQDFATLSIETWSICTIFLLDELECPRYIGFHFMNLSPGHRMWWRGRRPHTKSWRWACESVAKSSRFYVWCKVASVSVQTLQVRQTMHDHPHGTLQARSTVGMRCREPACHNLLR